MRMMMSAAFAAALMTAVSCGGDDDISGSGPQPPVPPEPPVFEWPDPDYVSSDFSADGEVETLQLADEGRGIDIVLMGEGFSDRLIANGHYGEMMRRAAEAFFSEEPFRSFRHLFNVYAVTAVSKNETVGGNAETAFSCGFEDGTTVIEGDDEACLVYAQQVPALRGNAERLNELVVIVVVNEVRWAGTCYPYGPYSLVDWSPLEGDCGRGFAVTYSAYTDYDDLAYTVVHEACGHGFAKLADEYHYADGTTISIDYRTYYEALQPYGYWRNVDFSGEPERCAWYGYMTDGRYAGTDIGYFEGGCYSEFGVWRSSRQSLMFYNEGGFNAVGREAIYRRIHFLAYGPSWKFDREEFVRYDAVNLVPGAAAAAHLRAPGCRRPLPAPRPMDRRKVRLDAGR